MFSSEELYERIENLRLQKHMSIAQLSRLAGISHGTLNSWKMRGTMPTLEVLDSLCFALGVSLSSVLYDVDTDRLTGEETELLASWKKLNGEQKQAILSTIRPMIR